MRWIINICLVLLPVIMVGQVRFSQLERCNTKFSIPVAKRTVPGIPDYVMTYMTLTQLIDSIDLVTGSADSTIIAAGWGIAVNESPANTWTVRADTSKVVTQYDINGMVTGTGTATRVAFWNGSNSLSSNANLYWDNVNSRLGVGTSNPARTLHVTGEARITDLTTDTPTVIVGADADGDLGTVGLGSGLSITNGTLNTVNNGTVTSVAATGGTGISVTGSPITSSGTLTITNTAPDQVVSITGGGINTVTGTYPSFTVTGTEVDGSTTNELQTITNTSDATTHTVTLSNTGGSVQLAEGSGISLTTTGTGSAGVVTIAATGGGVTSVTASSPLASSGGATPNITLDTTSTVGAATQYDLSLKLDKPSFTSGSVIFSGGGSTLSQDNNNIFYDNTNDRLGIGTNSPSFKLDVNHGSQALSGSTAAMARIYGQNTSNTGALLFGIQNTATPATNQGTGITLHTGSGAHNDSGSNSWQITQNGVNTTASELRFLHKNKNQTTYYELMSIEGSANNIGKVKIASLDTGNAAPTTNGTTKMVISDADGLLSYADIPSATGTVTSVSTTAGTGISTTVTNPTTTPNISITNTLPFNYLELQAGSGTAVNITNTQRLNLTGSGATTVTRSTAGSTHTFTISSTNTDNQTLSFSSPTLSISGGNSVNLPQLPTGSSSQTLAYLGGAWTASSFLKTNSSTTATGNSKRVDVNNDAGGETFSSSVHTSTKFLVNGRVQMNSTMSAPATNATLMGRNENFEVGTISLGDGLKMTGSVLSNTGPSYRSLRGNSSTYTQNLTNAYSTLSFSTPLSTLENDPFNLFSDSPPANTITVSVGGNYEISYGFSMKPTTGEEIYISLGIAGGVSTLCNRAINTTTDKWSMVQASHILTLSANDTVNIQIQSTSASNTTTFMDPILKVTRL